MYRKYRIYSFLKLYYDRKSNGTTSQKRNVLLMISETRRIINSSIQHRSLRIIEEYIANPKNRWAGRVLEEVLENMRSQSLTDLFVLENQVIIDDLAKVDFETIYEIKKKQLIILYFNPKTILEDLPIISGLMEQFEWKVTLPPIKEYTFWFLQGAIRCKSFTKDTVSREEKGKIVQRTRQMINLHEN